jgi:adenylate kinase family enzyme
MSLSVNIVSAADLCDENSAAAFSAFAAVRVGKKGTTWEQKGAKDDGAKAETGKQGGGSSLEFNETLKLVLGDDVLAEDAELTVRLYETSAEDNFIGESVVPLAEMSGPNAEVQLQGGTRDSAKLTFGWSRAAEEAAGGAAGTVPAPSETEQPELDGPPKAKPGEKENWLDEFPTPAFGHGDHSDEVRHASVKYSEPAGAQARSGKYDQEVIHHIFKNIEEMIESNLKAAKDGFGARTLFGTHIHNIMEVFVAMDVDKDGILSRREFSRALKRLGVGIPEKEVHMLFAQLDVNMNGSIEYGEFLRMFEESEVDKERFQRLQKDFNYGKKLSKKDKALRENHVRLIHYMNKKGGKSKLQKPNANRDEEGYSDRQTQRQEMARAKFASFSVQTDEIEDEKFLTPDDDEFRDALALLRKVPRKPTATTALPAVSKNSLNPWVVFVMGGPGSSAPQLCAELARLRGFTFIEAETIIREEIASSSMLGRRMLQSISQGRVPVDATISIIMRAIMAASGTRVLVHGFPQDLEQAQTYEHAVGKCQAVMYVKCSRRLMQKRLLGAGNQGGGTSEIDHTLTLQQARKRILDFEDTVEPVLTYFQLSSKVHVIRDGPGLGKLVTAVDNVLSSYSTPNRTFGTQTEKDSNEGKFAVGKDEFDKRVGAMKEKPSPFLPEDEQLKEAKLGPNGEKLNFKRGGTPIQESMGGRNPVPPSGEPGASSSPLASRATRATLRSRHGDPETESGPKAELARWFSRIGIMSGQPDNWRREFSGGFLISQILEIYFPRGVQSNGFHTGSSTQYKRDNWRQLQNFFLKNNLPLDDNEIKDLLTARKGKIVPFLLKLHHFIASRGHLEPLKNKPPRPEEKGKDSGSLPSMGVSTKGSGKSGKMRGSVSFNMDASSTGYTGGASTGRRR